MQNLSVQDLQAYFSRERKVLKEDIYFNCNGCADQFADHKNNDCQDQDHQLLGILCSQPYAANQNMYWGANEARINIKADVRSNDENFRKGSL